MKLVWLESPCANIPSWATPRKVACEQSDSAIAASAPPCTRPNGCLIRSSTGIRPLALSAVTSRISMPSVASRVRSRPTLKGGSAVTGSG